MVINTDTRAPMIERCYGRLLNLSNLNLVVGGIFFTRDKERFKVTREKYYYGIDDFRYKVQQVQDGVLTTSIDSDKLEKILNRPEPKEIQSGSRAALRDVWRRHGVNNMIRELSIFANAEEKPFLAFELKKAFEINY